MQWSQTLTLVERLRYIRPEVSIRWILLSQLRRYLLHLYRHELICWMDIFFNAVVINTLRTGDADWHLYITTVQDRRRKSVFLTSAWFPCIIHLITQYMEPVSEWSCWRMFIETWPHSELMICDKYREQRAFYIPLLLCSAFSQCSDFNHDRKR